MSTLDRPPNRDMIRRDILRPSGGLVILFIGSSFFFPVAAALSPLGKHRDCPAGFQADQEPWAGSPRVSDSPGALIPEQVTLWTCVPLCDWRIISSEGLPRGIEEEDEKLQFSAVVLGPARCRHVGNRKLRAEGRFLRAQV